MKNESSSSSGTSAILDKLGIYDLIAVLLPGISILTFSVLVIQYVYKIEIKGLQINETLTFLVLSYFIGLIFQEIGSLLQNKLIFRKDKLIRRVLSPSINSHFYLSETEKNGVYRYVAEKLNLNIDGDIGIIVYNYCKFYVLGSRNTTRIDKDQSLSAMSRSLSLYFLMLCIIAVSSLFYQISVSKVLLSVISAIFAIVLYLRCTRFAKLRCVNIIRTFCYNVIGNSAE